jgi:hypothetical protein
VAQKLSAAQQRRVDELQGFLKTVEHVKRLVAELDSNRAARQKLIDNITGSIERELSHLRQRALTSNVGTLADTAGALAVAAARSGGGLQMKIRALGEGVNSLLMQLDLAIKLTLKPPEEGAKGGGEGNAP